MGLIVQLAIGTAVLLIVWLKLEDFNDWLDVVLPAKFQRFRRSLINTIMTVFGIAIILDPLLPGIAAVRVQVPALIEFKGLREHLRVTVVPMGLDGLAGGDRTYDVRVGADGSAQCLTRLKLLETHVVIQLYDETAPQEILQSQTVYIGPLERRQLFGKTISLQKTGENNHG